MPRTKEVEMYGKLNGRVFKATFEPNEGESCIDVVSRVIRQFEKAGVELVDPLAAPAPVQLPVLPQATEPVKPKFCPDCTSPMVYKTLSRGKKGWACTKPFNECRGWISDK